MSTVIQASIVPISGRRRTAPKPAEQAESGLTPKEKKLIRQSFLKIEPALNLVAQLFFLKLFRLDPALRRKFAGPVEVQARKFAAGMKLTMITLAHEDGLASTLRLLGARHRQLGIRTRHYRTMSRALIWTLEQSLEGSFTRETKDAWEALLSHLTKSMSS